MCIQSRRGLPLGQHLASRARCKSFAETRQEYDAGDNIDVAVNFDVSDCLDLPQTALEEGGKGNFSFQ
ncbi:unnamed protein product [Periconia digitata]|uniref:Uncharacterized protein n=1 Tax=Periconia digitata TaxID=1303443 RepID=A0A9W4UX87_9PLEO|nr:unnamed protein product [Periconia digitata]